MTAAQPLPDVAPVPLPHMPRYPLYAAGAWRMTCKCCWWTPLATEPEPFPQRGQQ